MSTVTATSTREHRVTVRSLRTAKRSGRPVSMLTAYDHAFARIFDAAGIDVLLVGDSLGNVVQGQDTTLPVTLDEAIYHTRLVARAAARAMVVGDMPFGSYEASNEQAVANAQRFIKEAGRDAVKLERGGASVDRARAIIRAWIPVMGHVGLTPQTATALGGYKAQGRTGDRAHASEDRAARRCVRDGRLRARGLRARLRGGVIAEFPGR